MNATKPTLDSIATAKAKLAEELRSLEAEEAKLREQHASEVFNQVLELLTRYGEHFTARQRSELAAVFGSAAPATAKKKAPQKEVAPKYWLPHTQETWSGRGRPPRAFSAWEGTAAYKEWKATHPNEKFPSYPG